MSARVHPLITPVMSDAREEWCPQCKAYSLVCANLMLLTPHGVTRSHAYALCPLCEDPENHDRREDRRGR